MSFAIAMPQLSWRFGSGLTNLLHLVANPKFWSFVRDKSRFHTDARAFLAECDNGTLPSTTIGQFCHEHNYGTAFVGGWLLPFCEAVWSADSQAAQDMEAYTILTFLRNHAFLSWDVVQWFTPKGRTTVTLERFTALFKQLKVKVRTSANVTHVARQPNGTVLITLAGAAQSAEDSAQSRTFDDVVLATPAGTALKLIAQPTEDDTRCLAGFRSSQTELVVHTDPSLMPK